MSPASPAAVTMPGKLVPVLVPCAVQASKLPVVPAADKVQLATPDGVHSPNIWQRAPATHGKLVE
jgi:hypothetical protein